MAASLLLQPQLLRTALKTVSNRSCNAAVRQRLNQLGIPKSGRLIHTSIVRRGGHGNDSSHKAQAPEEFPPFHDGISPSRGGGPPGGDELLRRALGPDADNWKNWSPEKMNQESNYLLRLNKTDLDSEQNWISLGNDYYDRHTDIAVHRILCFLFMFQIISIVFIVCYTPDFMMRDWTSREAYLEIARREAMGLPLIDPDYIPPSKMLLPSDEELIKMNEEPVI